MLRAAEAKDGTLSGFSNRNVLSHRSGGWKSETEVSEGQVPKCQAESALGHSPGRQWFAGQLWHPLASRSTMNPDLCLPLHKALSVCMCECVHAGVCIRVCVFFQISPFYKDPSHPELRPALLQCDLILTRHICNGSSQKYGHDLTLAIRT